MSLYSLPYSLDFTLESPRKIARPDEAFGLPVNGHDLLARAGVDGVIDFDSLRVVDRHFIISNWEGQDTERYCPVQWVPAPGFHPVRNPVGTLFFRVTKFPWDDASFPRRYRLCFDTMRGGGKRAYVPDASDNTVAQTLQTRAGATTVRRADNGAVALGFSCPPGRKPGFHPLTTPNGQTITAEYPVDHNWHRGVWFAWTNVQGERTPVRPYTFWGEPRTGAITDNGVSHLFTGALAHGFTHDSVWATEYGVPLLEVRIDATWQTVGAAWSFLDLTLCLRASGNEAVTLDTNYGHLNLRSNCALREPVALDSAAEGVPIPGDDHAAIPVTWTGFGGVLNDAPACAVLCDAPNNALPGEDRPCWRDIFFERSRPFPRENNLMFLVTSLNPIRDRPLRLEPGVSRQWRYRVVTSDRALTADFAEYHQQAFAEPLTSRFS